jgi:hypothetical protein
MIDAALIEELRRFVAAFKRPEYVNDLIKACPNDLMKSIVEDNRSRPSSGGSMLPKVSVVGAGRVSTPDIGPAYRPYQEPAPEPADRSGWRDTPQLKPPDGVALVDQLVDQQDLLDFAARAQEQAAAMGIPYRDWLRLMEQDLRDRRARKEKADKARKETPPAKP